MYHYNKGGKSKPTSYLLHAIIKYLYYRCGYKHLDTGQFRRNSNRLVGKPIAARRPVIQYKYGRYYGHANNDNCNRDLHSNCNKCRRQRQHDDYHNGQSSGPGH